MKKTFLAVAVVTMLLASFAFAQDPHLAQHDYIANGVYQGCRGCHIPHGGAIFDSIYANRDTVFGAGGYNDPSTGVYKLWDKDISASGYQTYSSDNVTGEFMVINSTPASAHSYLCLSCHDGTMATINLPFAVSTTMDPAALLVNPAVGDFDLQNDHPVDITWPVGNAALDGDLYDTPTNVIAGTTGYDTESLPLYSTGNYYIECSTCHDPHEQVQSIPAGFRGNFLRLDLAHFDNTSLCRACHLGKR